MEELLSINITIADRVYPIRVKSMEQDLVKKAEELLNKKYHEAQLRFAGQENQDYLAMSAIMILVEQLKFQQDQLDEMGQVTDKLSELAKMIQTVESRL